LPDNLKLMRLIDEHHLEHPYVGRKGMTLWLNQQGYEVNIKRVCRLMKLMDLDAIYRATKPRQNQLALGLSMVYHFDGLLRVLSLGV
jgi:hypothetical protein